MYRRHLKELVGKTHKESGLTVCGYSRAFDFEYQVMRHVQMAKNQWPDIDEKEQEQSVRLALAVGSCWLWPEQQMAFDFDANKENDDG